MAPLSYLFLDFLTVWNVKFLGETFCYEEMQNILLFVYRLFYIIVYKKSFVEHELGLS